MNAVQQGQAGTGNSGIDLEKVEFESPVFKIRQNANGKNEIVIESFRVKVIKE